MKHYKEMMEFIKECRRLCPWTSKQTLRTYRKQLLDEAKEVMQAVEKKDYQNLKEAWATWHAVKAKEKLLKKK